MSDSKFNMAGLHSVSSESRQATLQFGVWNGKYQLTIFKQGENKPTSISIPPHIRVMIMKMLQETIKAAPGARFPLIKKEFVQADRKYVVDYTLIIGKDENGVIYIDIKKQDSAPEKFPLRGDKSVERSGDPEGDGPRSVYAGETLLDFMKNVWNVASLLTRLNMPSPGAQRSGGNGNRPPAPTNTAVAVDDDVF